MAKAKLLKVQRIDKSVNRPNRIVAVHVVFDTRGKKARLTPVNTGLERMIRHTPNRTRIAQPVRILPSLEAIPILLDRPLAIRACVVRSRGGDRFLWPSSSG